MSAEKESGKSRALEVTALFVPEPVLSISASPAVIVRLIIRGRCTILYDEIDGVFGNAKAQEANTDLRSVLNGGYRRGAKVYRCNTSGKKVEVEELDAFAPVAVAGLRALPDTLASRSIFIHMLRRAPDEEVEPFRHRYAGEQAKSVLEALTEWCAERDVGSVEPDLPHGIQDRAADCWEPWPTSLWLFKSPLRAGRPSAFYSGAACSPAGSSQDGRGSQIGSLSLSLQSRSADYASRPCSGPSRLACTHA